jgi:hypothetical protein
MDIRSLCSGQSSVLERSRALSFKELGFHPALWVLGRSPGPGSWGSIQVTNSHFPWETWTDGGLSCHPVLGGSYSRLPPSLLISRAIQGAQITPGVHFHPESCRTTFSGAYRSLCITLMAAGPLCPTTSHPGCTACHCVIVSNNCARAYSVYTGSIIS